MGATSDSDNEQDEARSLVVKQQLAALKRRKRKAEEEVAAAAAEEEADECKQTKKPNKKKKEEKEEAQKPVVLKEAEAAKPPRPRTTPNKTLANVILAIAKKIDKLLPEDMMVDPSEQAMLATTQEFWNENHLMISLTTGQLQRPVFFDPSDSENNSRMLFHIYAACHMFKLHTRHIVDACREASAQETKSKRSKKTE